MNSVRNTVFWRIGLIAVSIVWCLSGSAGGTQTEVWTLSSFEELNRGELENVSLRKTGEIMLASQAEQIAAMEQQAMYVWALAKDSKENLYLGTGEEGRIFKISPEGEASLFFDSPEIGIMSLAVDAEDNVYAGSAPDGLIYKITPEGSQTTLYSTGEHYVWSLVFDANGILYAGTGDEGKVFQILPNGAGTVLYDSPQSHVMSLVYDIGGWLYAGTEGKGITYKIGLDGTAFALYDAEEQEVRALTLDSQGNLYIAAISSEFFAQAQAPAPGEQPEARPKDKVSKQSMIYRINPAGTVEKIVELPEALIYTMIADTNDELLAGTDEKGRMYRVLPEERTYYQSLMIETGNILALLRDAKGEIYIGTGDTGAVYHLSSQLAAQGSYLSPIYDAKVTATWGKVFWCGTLNQIALSTRTGNTEVPDDTWSAWSEELRNAEGSPVPNPPARFIQWKAILTTSEEDPQPVELEEVSVALLPHNLPPEIQQVGVFYPTTRNGQPDQSNASGSNSKAPSSRQPEIRKPKTGVSAPKQVPHGYIAIVWSANDPNNEGLDYTVALQGEHETKWHVVKEELEAPLYYLDTSNLADGGYYVKITAADTPANPPDRALIMEKVSERFVIDNTAPIISIALNQKQDDDREAVLVTVIAQDEVSRLERAEYSLDGDDWTAIFPDDEVTDSQDEKYSIVLSDLTPEEHLLVFRATDKYNNTGVVRFVFSPEEIEEASSAPEEAQPDQQPTQTP